SRWSRSYRRPLGLLAPSDKQMATDSTETSTTLVQRVKARERISCLPSAPEPRAYVAPQARATQLLRASGWEPAPQTCRRPSPPVQTRSSPPADSETP